MYQAPPQIPQVPNHDGSPQTGYYQVGDPGPGIGKIKTISSTFGPQPPYDGKPPACTFVGEEGIARATQQGMQVLRFADAPYCLCTQMFLRHSAKSWDYIWSFLDAHYRQLFWIEESKFGVAAEIAHATFLINPAIDAHLKGEPVRFWGAPPRAIVVTGDNVEIVQAFRRDVVPVKDIAVTIEDDDLVIRCPAFHEARFFQAETYNITLASAFLKRLAKAKS